MEHDGHTYYRADLKVGFVDASYSVSESSGMVEIAVTAFPDSSGNVPSIGIPFGLRITSGDGTAVGKKIVSDLDGKRPPYFLPSW